MATSRVAYDPRGGDTLDVLSGVEQGGSAGALGALNPAIPPLSMFAAMAIDELVARMLSWF